VATFRAVDPATGEELGESYPVAGWPEVDAALSAAPDLASAPPAHIAAFLDGYAARLEGDRDALCRLAHRETGLPVEPRLRAVELPRTTSQLRQAAAAVRAESWTQPTIDTSADVRSCYGPLGKPVLVLGPNNFPFAFNAVAGSDFACALAARNPVLAKGHPGHPGTTHAMFRHAAAALAEADLPPATVQLFHDVPADVGLRLAGDPRLGALAFTGSRRGGLALKAAADEAGIPGYLEMSSINPVFFLPGALAERGDALVAELVASVVLGAGQFCTNPGLVVLPAGDAASRFIAAATKMMAATAPGVLLGRGVLDGLDESVTALVRAGARLHTGGAAVPGPGFRYQPTLLTVSGATFLDNPRALQREAFGPATLIVLAEDLVAIARALEGGLTAGIYSAAGGADEDVYRRLAPILRARAGRLLDDKMPTGVAVSPAMNHGGPFPATSHPGFTAVGIPAAIRRFAALNCYDHVREPRLPPVLRDVNPGEVWRQIDGRWTQGDVR